MKKVFVLFGALFTMATTPAALYAQYWKAQVDVRVWLTDSVILSYGYYNDTLRFGLDPRATKCIDDSLGEFFMWTECGLFSQNCSQFFPPRGTLSCGDQTGFPVYRDYRKMTGTIQKDTFAIAFVGSFPMVFHWNRLDLQVFDSATIVVPPLNKPTTATANMLAVDSLVITDTLASRLYIFTKYPRITGVVSGPLAETSGDFRLAQNYPNPFNPSTRIQYSLAKQSRVSLGIYDILGREVAILADGIREMGSHEAEWNAEGVPSGIYLYRLTGTPVDDPSAAFTVARRLVLLR